MAGGDDAAASRRTAVMCPCGELGWPKAQASAERGRLARKLRRLPGTGAAVLARECDREDSEQYHVRIVQVKGSLPTPPPLPLTLPPRPYEPVPATKTPAVLAYQAAVTTALVLAIEQQGAGRLLPGTRILAKHYGMTRQDAGDVRAELLVQDVIRRRGDRYVTLGLPAAAPANSEGEL